ncbi:hypothetical protein [Geminocystis sp. NIES-3709]|uniref:hypothetical protein n=1 Tax=Geminocystis sp. NIES-3709 TaxID=1617448 RepID=UPI0005FC3F10|nr:hypothetical protein [Geminocystis sp. NIES-3709]BAQ63915.1 hypothetical protein GM3709_680 [Geminocystis sp. NIES-3709]
MNIQDSNSNSTQDNLLIVNELKKVNQKLTEIQKDNSTNNINELQKQISRTQNSLIIVIGLFILGIAFNIFYANKQYSLLQILNSNNSQQLSELSELNKLNSQINSPEKYEYQVVSPSDYVFDEEMNKYGQLGWKATDCRRATSSFSSSASYECIMIRKK